MDFQVRNNLLKLLPTELAKRAVVAGGYAADPFRAQDIDMWILGVPIDDFTKVSRHIRSRLAAQDYDYELPDPVQTYGAEIDFHFIATVSAPGISKPVQILATSHTTAESLLNRFDVSSHQIAIGIEDLAITITDTFTATDVQPRLTNITTLPSQNLKRLERICKRYGFEPLEDDLRRLDDALERAA